MMDTRVVQCGRTAALGVETIFAEHGVRFEKTQFARKRLKGIGGLLIANHICWATHRERGRGDRTDGRHWHG